MPCAAPRMRSSASSLRAMPWPRHDLRTLSNVTSTASPRWATPRRSNGDGIAQTNPISSWEPCSDAPKQRSRCAPGNVSSQRSSLAEYTICRAPSGDVM
eukprot:scaffold3836_cov125-Isochrysis_galbana.AAC.3